MPILFLVLYILFASATVVMAGSRRRLRLFTKPVALPFLGLFYYYTVDTVSMWILLALVFGLVGDVFLLSQKRKRYFIAGLTAFLAGHIFYVIHFISFCPWESVHWPLMVVLGLILIVIGIIIQRQLKSISKVIRIPVIFYTIVIGTMALGSFTRVGGFSGLSLWMPIAGAFLFMLSDSLIAFRNFKRKSAILSYLVSITYYLAQFLLVAGLSII